ncbi:MAG: hypothetical protein J3R72DRAFT_241029 [Linnemannia gamsii]|nr:MAG: hypothetical protein J3R72DRAFT_241029 [Linnemannia gamsii]
MSLSRGFAVPHNRLALVLCDTVAYFIHSCKTMLCCHMSLFGSLLVQLLLYRFQKNICSIFFFFFSFFLQSSSFLSISSRSSISLSPPWPSSLSG